ncbi:MAG: hypothetical protein ACLQLO_34410 [Mycobacterium sp.]
MSAEGTAATGRRAVTGDLLDAVVAAHGGLDRWREFSTIEATIISGG